MDISVLVLVFTVLQIKMTELITNLSKATGLCSDVLQLGNFIGGFYLVPNTQKVKLILCWVNSFCMPGKGKDRNERKQRSLCVRRPRDPVAILTGTPSLRRDISCQLKNRIG